MSITSLSTRTPATLVLGGAVALGLAGTLVPAALVGRARLTTFAGARE